MTDLSPAAQALLAAIDTCVTASPAPPTSGDIAAAVLEAQADQIHAGYPLSDTIEDCIRGAEREHIRARLYSQAAELRGGADG